MSRPGHRLQWREETLELPRARTKLLGKLLTLDQSTLAMWTTAVPGGASAAFPGTQSQADTQEGADDNTTRCLMLKPAMFGLLTQAVKGDS